MQNPVEKRPWLWQRIARRLWHEVKQFGVMFGLMFGVSDEQAAKQNKKTPDGGA